GLMEALFWRAAGPLTADDEPSAVLLAGMTVCAADGMLVNVADTPQNRAMFGCTGTAAQEGQGPAALPQLRIAPLPHRGARAAVVREAHLTRWSASETTFGEDKTTITGAGNRTSGPVLRSGSPRLVISEAWAWLTATQLVRASAAAALNSQAAAARALRRKDNAPVTADQESFTAARLHMLR